MIEVDIEKSLGKSLSKMSDEENEIYKELLQLSMNSLLLGLSNLTGKSEDTAKDDYDKQFKILEDRFGTAKLRSGNYNEEKFNEMLAVSKEEDNAVIEDRRDEFMNQKDAKLTAKEVQYNLNNHRGERFYLEGTVEICDYYNYGFTNEKDFFCGKITPFDGGNSDSWYLYFSRKSFENLYNHLIGGNTFDLMVIAEIPYSGYKKGQGNMAAVRATQSYKP